MANFNWGGSYPPGCSGPPDDQYDDITCMRCNAAEGVDECESCGDWLCAVCYGDFRDACKACIPDLITETVRRERRGY